MTATFRRRRFVNALMTCLMWASMLIALIPLVSVLWTVVSNGIVRFDADFLTHNVKGVIGGFAPHGGIAHAMIGTIEITIFAMILAIPVGVLCAVWLVEYAQGTKPAAVVDFLVDIMAGIPSIVAGLFAYSLFSLFLGPGAVSGAIGAVALGLLMLPTVIRTTEEMLHAVPHDVREASYGLGVTKARTITRVVLPAAAPGIISGVILAISRVIGETAPLLVTTGVLTGTNWNIFSGRMMTLPVYVYQEYAQGLASCPSAAQLAASPLAGNECVASIRSQRAWAAVLALVLLVLILSIIGRLISRAARHTQKTRHVRHTQKRGGGVMGQQIEA